MTRPTALGLSFAPGRRRKAQFSLVMDKNMAIQRASNAIQDDQWTPVRYPNAVQDPDAGAWISAGEVAEIPYTAGLDLVVDPHDLAAVEQLWNRYHVSHAHLESQQDTLLTG